MICNDIKTCISSQCHSVKRLSRIPCVVCTLERRCQLTSKVEHGGRHASREVCELIRIETSLAFREADRARLAWRDRHPCVRTACHGVITTALTFSGIYTSTSRHRWQTVWGKALAQVLPLGRSLDTGPGTRTGTGAGTCTGIPASRRLR